ncbi:hypothetical protein CHS0354_006914 [Potamilus streckersoni]|uniref:MoaB/Mog domain-containing protein n=1 Tax=Potamilus streckersoni TaxID=2493646 RepID=A0AAE0TFR4_9BIVA|nr:hypothetical protein CHS0354_006914 [Potamilus streckersoni]
MARVEEEIIRMADELRCHVIFTTGGTGPAPRDITPDATPSIEFRRQNLTAYGIPDCGIFPAGEENYGEKNYPLKSAAISGLYREEDTAFFLDDITRNYDDVQTCLPAIHTYLIRRFENNHLELPGYK